jgi:hypothetical protein
MRHAHFVFPVVVWFVLINPNVVSAEDNPPKSPDVTTTAASAPLPLDQVVQGMVTRNIERMQALKTFQGKRIYKLEYKGFPSSKSAEMQVEVRFSAPATKQFVVSSQSGSAMLINRVLKKLLESESEAMNDAVRERNALTPTNYRFALDHVEQTNGRLQYVLQVEPRRDDKFLYRGKIWVDGQDFAVARIEAEPAKNPSFWVKKTEISHQYSKVGDFWLPAQNLSKSSTRFGGHAILTIEYMDYRVNQPTQP